MHDLVIRGGLVVDGTGAPARSADVAIDAGRISALGRLESPRARRTLRADGLVVAPGFIDMHAHSDLVLFEQPEHPLKVLQGVTTELLGQDGLSYAPIAPEALAQMRDTVRAINGAPDMAYDWTSVAGYLERLADARPAVNAAYLVPHGAVRLSVTGMADRVASDAELRRMAQLVAEGMADGAVGLSTGLTYPPGQWADTREIVALARAAAARRGIYVTHHRDYGAGLRESVEEALSIGRDAGLPVHFSHFHVSGRPWRGRASELLALIDAARADGADVSLDTYPYLAGSTFLGAWIPEWLQAGSPDEVVARLADPTQQPAVIEALERGPRQFIHASWDDFVIAGAGSGRNRELEGLRIPEAAARRGVTVGRLVCDLLIEERMAVSILAFVGDEANVRAIMGDPAWMVGTDAILVGGSLHPRAAGTYPTVLGTYVRDAGVLSMERAVRGMTGAPADRLGLSDRGYVREGQAADLALFDPDTVAPGNSYADPRRPPLGMPYVLVNGEAVKWDDAPTGARPGRIIRGDGKGRAAA